MTHTEFWIGFKRLESKISKGKGENESLI